MMIICLNIDPAVFDDFAVETARILRDLADKMDNYSAPNWLNDADGRKVGRVLFHANVDLDSLDSSPGFYTITRREFKQ